MLAESTAIANTPDTDLDTETGHVVVYEGFLTNLIQVKLSLSVPYYTSVRRSLMDMGCIRQLRRGGGTSPSQWEMITEPTLEMFMSVQPDKKPKQTKEGMFQDQILALSTRLSDVETTVEELVGAWAKFFGAQEKSDG